MSAPALIKVGVVASAHGIRGQVKIRSLTVNPEDICGFRVLTDATGKKPFKIALKPAKLPLFIAEIDGIADRNAAELLKGTGLYAPADKLKKNPQDELIGMPVQTKDGKLYGSIIAMHNFGAGDIIEIARTDGTQEMLPSKPDFLSIKGDKITVFPPEYIESNKE